MNVKARAIKNLYRIGRISIDGVRQAIINNIITAEEFELITGTSYN